VLAQCPHCRTVFAVSGDHLEAAGGRVRCGHCLKPFNANLHVVEDLPPSSEAPDAGEPTPALSDTLRQVAALPESQPAPRPVADPAPEPVASEAPTGAEPQVSPETGLASPPLAGREPAVVPEVLAADAAAMMKARTPWYVGAGQGVAVLVLLVLGLAQYAWFMPEDLLQRFPQAGPWLEKAFRSAGHELAVPRDLSRLRLMSRDVRVHQGYANVLQVNAKLVNQALTQRPVRRHGCRCGRPHLRAEGVSGGERGEHQGHATRGPIADPPGHREPGHGGGELRVSVPLSPIAGVGAGPFRGRSRIDLDPRSRLYPSSPREYYQ
jgi:predicted Zn finger-like uncharacterized protein